MRRALCLALLALVAAQDDDDDGPGGWHTSDHACISPHAPYPLPTLHPTAGTRFRRSLVASLPLYSALKSAWPATNTHAPPNQPADSFHDKVKSAEAFWSHKCDDVEHRHPKCFQSEPTGKREKVH